MALKPSTLYFGCAALFLLFFSTPVAAFGAGNIINISKIAGKNWRHGDIEDVLLELFLSKAGNTKFDTLAVKRVYFGNWLRDYSQALDVGGLSKLPKETIRILLWVLSFLTFGFATKEFEVTEDKLGVYRPEEHIDNPKDYNDNADARQYDSRLRGPVDEAKELAIDQENGMKVYIASENKGIDTSAGLVRKVFKQSIELGRKYGREGRSEDLYEALRLLGTGLHCIEDFAAHSNYIELALKELGVDAFPHVGDNTRQNIKGKEIYPLVTGTFGMTDFLHSVVGEVSDKMFQSEVQQLDSKLSDAHNNNEATSRLKQILDKVPWGLLGVANDFSSEADNLQANSAAKEVETKAKVSDNSGNPKVEEIKKQAVQTAKEIYPILEFHDQIFKAVHEGIEKIPFANQIVENLTGALQIYIFSLLAPYVTPILAQVKEELKAGSAGVLASSEKGQYKVFEDDNCHDPTHSMLSKDHFTNVLNPVAGQVAEDCVRFAVPRIVNAWEDSGKNPDDVINDILQVFHHPALREQGKVGQEGMFEVVKRWWESKRGNEQDDLRQKLSKQGVKNGDNHEGEDHSGAPGGKGHSHAGCGKGHSHGGYGRQEQSSGGYGASNRRDDESSGYGRQQNTSGYGSSNRRDEESSGYGRQQQSSSYGSSDRRGGESSGYGHEQQSSGYGSYNRRGEESSGYERQQSSGYGSSNRREEESYSRRNDDNERSSGYGSSRRDEDNSRSSGYGSSNRRDEDNSRSSYNTSSYGSSRRDETERSSYGEPTSSYGRKDEDNSRSSYNTSAYGSSRRDDTYGESNTSSYGRRNDEDNSRSSYGQSNTSSYGRRDEDNERSSGYGSRRNDDERSSYDQGNTTSSSYGANRRDDAERSSYGQSNTSSYGRREDDNERSSGYGSRRDDSERSSYGQSNTSSYGRGDDDNERSSYTQSSSYGRRDEDAERSSYGQSSYGSGRRDEGSLGYGGQEESYGSGYGRQEESYGSGYGSRRGDEGERGGYGGRGDEEEREERRGGYGGRRDEERSGGGGWFS